MHSIDTRKSIGLHFEKKEFALFKTEKGSKRDLASKIYLTILFPRNIHIAIDLDIQPSFDLKIRSLTRNLLKKYESNSDDCSIYTDKYFNNLIEKILDILVDRKSPLFLKKRALASLNIFENSIPELEPLCAIVRKSLQLPPQNEYEKALQRFIPKVTENLEFRPSQSPGVGRSQLASISNTGDVAIAPTAGAFASVQNQVFSHLGYSPQEIEVFTHHTILYGMKEDDDDYYRNLQQIAKLEKIPKVLPISNSIRWLRDPFIITKPDDKLLLPSRITPSTEMDIWEIASEITEGDNFIGSVAERRTTEKFIKQNIHHHEAPYYFEGGNCLRAVNKFGDEIELWGAQNILFSLLNGGRTFLSKTMRAAILQKLQKSKTDEEQIDDVFEKIKKIEFLRTKFGEKELFLIAKIMIVGIDVIIESIKNDLNKNVLVIGDVFEEPPEYHLDIYLMPAPGGKIFIQDHLLCCNVLENLLDDISLTSQEKERLTKYLCASKMLYQKHLTKYYHIKRQLEYAGFIVISVAGVYYLDNKFAVNYLNAITGISPKGTYCITNGSSHSLDRHLRDPFTLALQSHGIDRVYYAGKKRYVTAGAGNIYETVKQTFRDGGGVHCKTQTLSRDNNHLFVKSTPTAPEKKVPFDKATIKFYAELIKTSNQ